MKQLRVLCAALCLAACGDGGKQTVPNDTVAGEPSAPRGPRPGARFDPTSIQPGDTVGALVTVSVEVRRTAVDSISVGVARFRGSVELNGWTLRHPDSDVRDVARCFEADSASASRLPRWAGDERRPWFCFANQAEAARALGPSSDRVPATIVIEDFTIYRGMSDEVNSARFVRLARGPSSPP
jgi:hypothetical protein